MMEPTVTLGEDKKRGQARNHGWKRFKGRELKVITSQASYNVLTGNKNVLGSSREILKHMHKVTGIASNKVEGMDDTPPEIQGVSLICTKKQLYGNVATEVRTSPANISYNTQGALNESPLDISNIMNESDGNAKWQALHTN
ncbi:hypothetical protein DSO57_1033195 [Entomophthora muscae]|uniref:Uncharacterized protein n=1 Tax=Entomophthora muscae TaxID=34485 RepID=A0ACC2RR50_9FUNG|nr:hypothetical protein DSO57_1033195 [Entomophthora muscae]